jgi:hypothetical protein
MFMPPKEKTIHGQTRQRTFLESGGSVWESDYSCGKIVQVSVSNNLVRRLYDSKPTRPVLCGSAAAHGGKPPAYRNAPALFAAAPLSEA